MRKILILLSALLALTGFRACSENDITNTWETWKFPQDTPIILQFNQTKNFRILQLTDLHYDQSDYATNIQHNVADLVTLTHPDLIVLTGDIVSGQPPTYRWLLFSSFLSQLKIPYLITLGNHDSEHKLVRNQLYTMIRNFPYCQNARFEDSDAFVSGDMVVPVLDSESGKPGALLYLFDSHDYNSPEKQLGMRPAQANWFKHKNAALLESTSSSIPALVFMHVPLTQYRKASSMAKNTQVGSRGEKEYVGMNDDEFFNTLKEAGNVCGVFCGHDHYNDYVQEFEGIALCYGRKSGSHNTYQRYPSGGRVIDLYLGEKGFSTFIQECNGAKKHPYLYNR